MNKFISSIQKNGKVFALCGFGQLLSLVLLCILFEILSIELPAGNLMLYIACAIVGFLCLCIGFIGLTGIIQNKQK